MIKQFFFFLSLLPISLFGVDLGGYLSLGPEVYYAKKIRASGSKQRGVLFGAELSFNRIKPCTFYFGADGYYAKGILKGTNASGRAIRSSLIDMQAEGRIGYNFPYFTPFVGYGYLEENNNFLAPSTNQFHYHDSIQYLTVGFLSYYPIKNRIFIGLDAKVKEMVDGRCRISNDPLNPPVTLLIGNERQYRVDLPLSYKSERSGLFVTFDPFYEYRHYGGHESYPFDFIAIQYQIWGGQLLFSYRF